MAYNQTLLPNVTDVGKMASFISLQTHELFFVLFVLGLIIVVTIYGIRNNMREFKAIFLGFTISLIPTVLLTLIQNFGVDLIPPWFIILHITLWAISGAFAYLQK